MAEIYRVETSSIILEDIPLHSALYYIWRMSHLSRCSVWGTRHHSCWWQRSHSWAQRSYWAAQDPGPTCPKTVCCTDLEAWGGCPKKCLNVRQKLGTWSHSLTLNVSHSHSLSLSFTHSRHTEQLLFSCLCSKVTLSLSHSLTLTLSHSLIHSLSTCWTTFVFMSRLRSHCL